MDKGVIVPLLGALQACVSVLLTMSFGAAAQRLRLIQKSSIDDVAALGMKLLLPALIITHLGEQLELGNLANYGPVLAWSIIYTSISIGLAYAISKMLKLPAWVIPACAFNNTTSLPLLLLQSLESVGSLKLIIEDGDTESDAIARAQSYFILCAVVSNTIGYAVGPKILKEGDQDVDEQEDDGEGDAVSEDEGRYHHRYPGGDEETSLLPRRGRTKREHGLSLRLKNWMSKASVSLRRVGQEILAPFKSPVTDVAIGCTLLGAVLGLVPQLHKAFFASYEDGGIFNAWLTSSVKNIGKLFTTLQIFVVGCKLGVSFEQMRGRGGGGSGRTPFKAVATIFVVRLVLWPALSISLIYLLARRTGLVQSDPILWFSLMLMPAGPPALVISGLAELARVSQEEKMAIAKTLTIMYALSPFICFSITGALKASQAVREYKSAM
ncbi:Auxin Efflux Carrier superfamily [Aspergillus melleus]|uniref:Auxin Efflux Carrier superfamily n=1 Tax=Aspergillus melleus TaxID=138277 RepID=UPI001E8D975F|nr:uncharacterized protein LDX57_008343 [Aspergillus melleus]KAH8430681.1 hypothetical protein LDX57_008343 [Aspergillus melleus]